MRFEILHSASCPCAFQSSRTGCGVNLRYSLSFALTCPGCVLVCPAPPYSGRSRLVRARDGGKPAGQRRAGQLCRSHGLGFRMRLRLPHRYGTIATSGLAEPMRVTFAVPLACSRPVMAAAFRSRAHVH